MFFFNSNNFCYILNMFKSYTGGIQGRLYIHKIAIFFSLTQKLCHVQYSNMTSFKSFESKPVVKIIYTYTHCNLWRHRQFITIFYQFLHIRIEIIHGSHMYILFLLRVGLHVSFLSLANTRGKICNIKVYPW